MKTAGSEPEDGGPCTVLTHRCYKVLSCVIGFASVLWKIMTLHLHDCNLETQRGIRTWYFMVTQMFLVHILFDKLYPYRYLFKTIRLKIREKRLR